MASNAVSKVSSKGQVTVPELVRKRLELARGDRIEWTVTKDRIEVRKVEGRLQDLAGLLGKPQRAYTVEELDGALKTGFRKRYRAGR